MSALTIPMFTGNFSRIQIETGLPIEIGQKDWLISISDANGMLPFVPDRFGELQFYFFDDQDEPDMPGVISPLDAMAMAGFIRAARINKANVWVHCTAGMCRSGAVVEVLKLLGWRIMDDFSPQRVPNVLVFNMLRKEFPELLYSWEQE